MKLTLKQIRLFVLFIALLVLVSGLSYRLGQKRPLISGKGNMRVEIDRRVAPDKQEIKFALFWEVWDRVVTSYLNKDKIDAVNMVYGAISGMVASLGDPYTAFLPPGENQRAEEDLAGAFGGIGIQLGFIDHQLAVIAPLTGTPAERAGIRAGDFILAIDGQETTDMALPQAVNLIRGKRETKVILTVLHEGDSEVAEIGVLRDTILVKSVEVEFLDKWCSRGPCPLVAHLKLMRFGDRTNSEWTEAVGEILERCPLGGETCRGIVLDLRNNPGGYLDSSVFIASEFLSSGTVVQEEMASGIRQDFPVNRQGELINPPLVVLVNKGSASASEIVAGALKEHQRAKIVGESTFGKGTIQEAEDFEGGAGLYVTTARWLLPSGQSIDGQGLAPNLEIEADPEQPEKDLQLDKAIEVLDSL